MLVKVVCSSAWNFNSDSTVIADTAYAKSIAAKGNTIPHIADHKLESTSHVGDVIKVYTEQVDLSLLGLASSGNTTSLIMETNIREDYNAKVYQFYQLKKINQHSIGFNFKYEDVKLGFQSSLPEDSEENAIWETYLPKIINQQDVLDRGYFLLIEEIDILENSCVLFGANSLTPTLETETEIQVKTQQQHQLSIKEGVPMSTEDPKVSELKTQVQTLTNEATALKQALDIAKVEYTQALAQALAKQTERVVDIIKTCQTLNTLNADDLIKDISSKHSAEEVRDMHVRVKEMLDKHVSLQSVSSTETITQDKAKDANPVAEFYQNLNGGTK